MKRLQSSFTKLDHVANVSDLTQRANLLCGHILENWLHQNSNCKDPRRMMFVWYTGASYGLIPFMNNLIYYVRCDITVKEVTKLNRVIGIVTTLHKFIEINGQDIFLPRIYYHLTQTDVNLFSPKIYHKSYVGNSLVHWNQVTIRLPFHRIHITVDLGGTNLPVLHNSFVTENQNRAFGP